MICVILGLELPLELLFPIFFLSTEHGFSAPETYLRSGLVVRGITSNPGCRVPTSETTVSNKRLLPKGGLGVPLPNNRSPVPDPKGPEGSVYDGIKGVVRLGCLYMLANVPFTCLTLFSTPTFGGIA